LETAVLPIKMIEDAAYVIDVAQTDGKPLPAPTEASVILATGLPS
jgi:hypothetical protein